MNSRWLRILVLAFLVSCAGAASAATPTFLTRYDYPGLTGEFVQVADVNGDSIPDLLVSAAENIIVLYGNGDGTFRQGSSNNFGVYAVSFAVADVNGDGRPDLVIPGGGEIAVVLGNGDGTFQPPSIYTFNDTSAYEVVVGDFNGDGVLDIVTAGNAGLWLFSGKGDGTFNPGVTAASLPSGAGYIAAGDFTGDKKLGVVVALTLGGPHEKGAGSLVFVGNGDGTFQSPLTLAEPQSTTAVSTFTRKTGGPASVAISAYRQTETYVYAPDGVGGFSKPRVVDLPGVGRGGLSVGDLNQDGLPDLVSSGGYVAFGNAQGGFGMP